MQPHKRQSFVYSFDLAKDISHINFCDSDMVSSIECNIVKIIYESFVIPADQDYLTARLLALNGLPRGFFWGAAQAAEKYLKAFLLMRGKSVIEYRGHPIVNLFKAARELEPELRSLDPSPHPSIENTSGCELMMQKFSVTELLLELENHGTPDNRYNSTGVDFNTGHLLALDSFVYQFRQMIGVPSIMESHNSLSEELKKSFENVNPWFSEDCANPIKLPSKSLPLRFSMSVTHLDFMCENQSSIVYQNVLTWLNRKMRLSRKQVAVLKISERNKK